jgi:hypothetical protein
MLLSIPLLLKSRVRAFAVSKVSSKQKSGIRGAVEMSRRRQAACGSAMAVENQARRLSSDRTEIWPGRTAVLSYRKIPEQEVHLHRRIIARIARRNRCTRQLVALDDAGQEASGTGR